MYIAKRNTHIPRVSGVGAVISVILMDNITKGRILNIILVKIWD